MNHDLSCPVCRHASTLLGAVDFNKSCAESLGTFLPHSGLPIHYALCDQCGFCFAPEMNTWTAARLAEQIYNKDYILVDPEYAQTRPRYNANSLLEALGQNKAQIEHLDYGGGAGVLSDILRSNGWRSRSYDPFVQSAVTADSLGKGNLITAYEVFEHAADPHQLMGTLNGLLADDGLILFSTLVSDGHITRDQPLTWWYASPRNGHVSLFSRQSLFRLASDHGFQWASFSDVHHALFRKVPAWAKHLIDIG